MGYFIPPSVVSVVVFSWSQISVVGDLMFLVVTNTREHLLRYFALLRLTEALPLTMAESLPEISRGEQADILLRQIHAPPSAPPALAIAPRPRFSAQRYPPTVTQTQRPARPVTRSTLVAAPAAPAGGY